MVQQPANSAPPTQKSLNLPLPPRFSGSPSELNSSKLRLIQYLGSNMDAYIDSHHQILFAGSLMDGPASRWYESLIDQSTYHVPSTYCWNPGIRFVIWICFISSRGRDGESRRENARHVIFVWEHRNTRDSNQLFIADWCSRTSVILQAYFAHHCIIKWTWHVGRSLNLLSVQCASSI